MASTSTQPAPGTTEMILTPVITLEGQQTDGTRSSLHIKYESAVHKRRLWEGRNPVLAHPSAESDGVPPQACIRRVYQSTLAVRKLQPPAEEPVAGEQAVLLTPPVVVREDTSTGAMDQKSTSEEEVMSVARRPPRPSANERATLEEVKWALWKRKRGGTLDDGQFGYEDGSNMALDKVFWDETRNVRDIAYHHPASWVGCNR
ncbi:hypothetical protein AZE42_08529 [Rhizopogon vesiculosus]|uniref:Uncharacterized protein n=1 Tax=Rhizopogon vesiculosus TaxID=180088 RepID=A0A1J8PNE7_9AGAM|nr:hypothetical protein AZE42_08529 [Rhizopogon vesiculosus]